jgi:hypothetical protein
MRRPRKVVATVGATVAILAASAGVANAVTFTASYGNVNVRPTASVSQPRIGVIIGSNSVAAAGTVVGGAYSCFGFNGSRWRLVYPSFGNGYVGSLCGNT